MSTIQVISKFPEHPLIEWKTKLLEAVPLGDLWWPRFYNYLIEHAEHPNEVGYTLSKLFDLIAKNNANELIVDMPTYLPRYSGVDCTEDILEGVVKYRNKLGHIMNRNLPLLSHFKKWHWDLFLKYAKEPTDHASNILLWAWSKPFWTPMDPAEFYDKNYRYLPAALILRNQHVQNKDLFEKIKKYWTDNNKQLPKQTDFYSKDIEIKSAAWFFWLCPEYSESYYLFQYAAQTSNVHELYLLLCHGLNEDKDEYLELPELKISNL